jgi:hypothetical protein
MTKKTAVRQPYRRPVPTKIVPSRGQKRRIAKKENTEWKQKALEAAERARKVKQHGEAFGTMDELLTAVSALPSTQSPLNGAECVRGAKKGGKKKNSVRMQENETEKKRFHAIVNFDAFRENPLATIRQHLEVKSGQHK